MISQSTMRLLSWSIYLPKSSGRLLAEWSLAWRLERDSRGTILYLLVHMHVSI